MSPRELGKLLARANALERAGRHREAIAICEVVIDETEAAHFPLTLARNHYALAVRGNELHAWPALLAALDGIEQRARHQPDIVHAVGICRWVLEHFADQHRFDVVGCIHRNADRVPGRRWWDNPDAEAPGERHPNVADFEEIRRLIAAGEYVRAVNALLAAAPAVVRFGRSPESVGREARYLLGMVLSALSDEHIPPLLAADEFPPPGDHDGQPYDRYLFTAACVQRARLRALAAGVPGIVITALPKSASEFLSYTLAEALAAPVVRTTIGEPVLGTVHVGWAAAAARGGAVTHDHYAATPTNLAALRDAGVAAVWVLVRDPRAVFWSSQRMQAEYDGVPPAARMERWRVVSSIVMLCNWLGSWVRAREGGAAVRFVRFPELRANPAEVMGGILEASGAGSFLPKLHDVLRRRAEREQVSSNFRGGEDEAWRQGVPAEFHGLMWDRIPAEVRELLALVP
jgi:hypothetical protein